ncbi:MAG TPA: Nudix family hydrolase [Burkholderiales bacterium]|nr:Nudix family hydrolase [Burkholderiales bacterium]
MKAPEYGAVNQREVDVVAAVIEHSDGRFLLAQRPQGKVYAGYWEFPGGKVESGERRIDAISRELHEELGIEVVTAYPWITRQFTYPHARVKLHFYRVTRWHGELQGREGQAFSWESFPDLAVSPMLPANAPVLKALSLPTTMAITRAWEVGIDRAMNELQLGLSRGLRFVQLRERNLESKKRGDFAARLVRAVRDCGGLAVINGDADLAKSVGAGIHLTASELMNLSTRPDAQWCGASCHDAPELSRALESEMDYVVLGPVNATPSHPGAQAMGWGKFAKLVEGYPIPVLALGGMRPADLERARASGAHGIAMVRGAWE